MTWYDNIFKVTSLMPGSKLSRKIKEHGPYWRVQIEDNSSWLLATIKPIHQGKQPYMMWVDKNQCKLEPTGQDPTNQVES